MFVHTEQAQVFLAMVCAGLATGVLYDLLRLLRLCLRAGSWLTAGVDLLFWVLAASVCACAAALCGARGLRLYLLLGALCGALLWMAGLRRVIALCARAVGRILPRRAPQEAGKREESGE